MIGVCLSEEAEVVAVSATEGGRKKPWIANTPQSLGGLAGCGA
jgi:hypothetical protein